MKIKALILFLSAMICQSTAMRAQFTDMDTPEASPGKVMYFNPNT